MYAIFSGVGAIGSLVIDMVVFGKEIKLIEILFVALIIIGVVQLKRADS
ncbi:hypothetical protein GAPWK_1034 [Gilliamella apicola]|nr:hypothetical protein GAPWK_1034 [Gilliamella apicola]